MPVQQRPFFALGLRLCAALMVSTLFMLVKLAGKTGVSLPEIMFWRQAIPLPLILGWMAARGRIDHLATRRLPSHAGRAVSGTIGMVCNFGASMLLPLAVATVFNFTTPLFAVVLGAGLLHEQVGRWRWLAVLLGFLGVLVIAQPGSAGAAAIPPLGAAAGLGSGFMVALISIQIRDLGKTEQSMATVFWFSLFGTLFTAPFLPFVMEHHTSAQWLMLCGIGVVGASGQILMTSALRYGAVASVIVMDYSALIWTTIYSRHIFHQSPPSHIWLGAPLIVAAGLVIAWREHRLHKLTTRARCEAEAA